MVSIAVPSAPTSGATPTPIPTPAVKAAAGLRVTAAKLTSKTLTVSGAIASRSTGQVTVRYAATVRGRTLKTSKAVFALRGRFSARLTLPTRKRAARTGTVTVAYAGDARHLPQTASKSVQR